MEIEMKICIFKCGWQTPGFSSEGDFFLNNHSSVVKCFLSIFLLHIDRFFLFILFSSEKWREKIDLSRRKSLYFCIERKRKTHFFSRKRILFTVLSVWVRYPIFFTVLFYLLYDREFQWIFALVLLAFYFIYSFTLFVNGHQLITSVIIRTIFLGKKYK